MKAKRIIKKGKKFVNKNIVTKPRNVTYINYFKDCKVEPGTVLY